jgi:hypothetical protein
MRESDRHPAGVRSPISVIGRTDPREVSTGEIEITLRKIVLGPID